MTIDILIALSVIEISVLGYMLWRMPKETPVTEKRKELLYQVEQLTNHKTGADIIFPNPIKEAFDSGKVTDVGDIL